MTNDRLTKFGDKTKDGTPIRNLHITEDPVFPIAGEHQLYPGKWHQSTWTQDGFFVCGGGSQCLDLVICGKKRMKWTKELPTKEGWYWYKGVIENEQGPRIFDVRKSSINSSAFYADNLGAIKRTNGYWYGPIEEPEGLKCEH